VIRRGKEPAFPSRLKLRAELLSYVAFECGEEDMSNFPGMKLLAISGKFWMRGGIYIYRESILYS
jgi:hypothetical protein